ncbi:hypothetical protein MTO96_046387, partial [Rhipicephalus appendiculatus]
YSAPQNHPPKRETVWYTNYGTGARWQAGIVQAPEGHRMVTIKAADGEHHRRYYDQQRARKTRQRGGLNAGEAEVKLQPGVEALQTEAGETGIPDTPRGGPRAQVRQTRAADQIRMTTKLEVTSAARNVIEIKIPIQARLCYPGPPGNRRPRDRYQPQGERRLMHRHWHMSLPLRTLCAHTLPRL